MFVLPLFFGFLVLKGQEVFHYDFDDCTYEDSGLRFPGMIPGGSPECVCGLGEKSLYLDGANDFVSLDPQATLKMDSNFTLDFYFQLDNIGVEVDIFSIRFGCNNLDSMMSFRYFNNTNDLAFEMGSNTNNYFSVKKKLDKGNCWHRFTLTKFELEYRVYFDNVLVKQFLSKETIKFTRRNNLHFANSPCNGVLSSVKMKGFIDEISLYKRALSDQEIVSNFLYQDRIITENTTIFKGDTIQLLTGESCTQNIAWTPASTLDNPHSAIPKAAPDVTTTYQVAFDNGTCISQDSVTIYVAEKEKLDCTNLLLPKAFTPNNDGLNDRYGISNTFLVEKLDYFEIYNRWGAKLWETSEKNEMWDGTSDFTLQTGGMYLYKIKYTCNGTEYTNIDNFMMLR